MSGRMLTTHEVAERLNVSKATVLRKVDRGEIPAFRIATNQLRYDGDEIDAWLTGTRTASRPGGRLAAVPDRRSEHDAS
jgi:excisionase family DNA binding protein